MGEGVRTERNVIMTESSGNILYYGDNLDILRRYIKDETVDLVYLDPPFNSNANYNVLFAEKNGSKAASQIRAFSDTWTWNQESESIFSEIVMSGGRVSDCLQAFRTFLGECDMLAYLVMMAPRLVELRRVMKTTASIYLHCDPTASHYLKMLMDAVFGPENFRNEIVWRRSHPKGHAFTRLASTHDVILAYARNAEGAYWSPIYLPHDPERAEEQYSLADENGRRYQLTSLLNPNPDRPNLTYEFKGVTKVWRWSRSGCWKQTPRAISWYRKAAKAFLALSGILMSKRVSHSVTGGEILRSYQVQSALGIRRRSQLLYWKELFKPHARKAVLYLIHFVDVEPL